MRSSHITPATPPGRRADQLIEHTTRIDQLLDAAFSTRRDPRSPEYRAGARATLAFRIDGTKITTPYAAGTAADDAFYSGIAEGHAIWRRAVAAGAV